MFRYTGLAYVVFLVSVVLLVESSHRGRSSSRRHHYIAGSHRCSSDLNSSEEIMVEFDNKILKAQFVFTGKVLNITKDGQDQSLVQFDGSGRDFFLENTEKMFAVRVKRALKGKFPGSLTDVELTKPHTQQVVQILVGKHVSDDKNRCYHTLRVHHSAIFLADQHGNNSVVLKLTSSPLALTLQNLDRVNAAVKDVFYKPRSPIIEEPCEKTYCAFGANCVVDSSGRPHCQCPVNCPKVFTPVCGTDGITYSSRCMLHRKSCQNEENTRVRHTGECGIPVTDDGWRQ